MGPRVQNDTQRDSAVDDALGPRHRTGAPYFSRSQRRMSSALPILMPNVQVGSKNSQ
ncbi:hypothetical protein C7821_111182 [Streptomyces sp. VMFN-G11Ma]|nr:hypothetical protein C7821_111182 [Streptomyces sp. VMFN-G11Ma]